MFVHYACSTWKSQNRESDALQLQIDVSRKWRVGIKSRAPARAASAFNLPAISQPFEENSNGSGGREWEHIVETYMWADSKMEPMILFDNLKNQYNLMLE